MAHFSLSFIPSEMDLVQWSLDFTIYEKIVLIYWLRVKEKANYSSLRAISSHNKVTLKYHYFIYFCRNTFGHVVLSLTMPNKSTNSLAFSLFKHSFSLPSSETQNLSFTHTKKEGKKSFQLVLTMSQWGQCGWHHPCHYGGRQTQHRD